MIPKDLRNYETSETLQHYGILGQKWGVRRFQNEDGTRTSAGKRRYSSNNESKESKDRSKWFEQNIKGGKDKPNVSPAEKTLGEARKTTESASNIVRTIGDIKKTSKKSEDLSKYSNAELRAMVERMNLERQYNTLTNSDTSKGEKYALAALSIAGDVLAIGVSLATIYSVAKGTKK